MRKIILTEQEEISPAISSTFTATQEYKDIYNFYYNVEYFWGNGVVETFNAKLQNAGGGYFWFIDDEGALFKIKQSRVLMMIPTGKVKNDGE